MRWAVPSSSAATGKDGKGPALSAAHVHAPAELQGPGTGVLIGYWQRGKDIIAVTHFADLMPEVLFLDDTHNDMRETLIENRITFKTDKYYAREHPPGLKEEIITAKQRMRQRAEEEILRRVNAIRMYLLDPKREMYISHEQIFNTYMEN